MNKEQLEIYYDGIKHGISMYAWWKDGVQYVGTTGKTLKQANTEIHTQFESDLKKLVVINNC